MEPGAPRPSGVLALRAARLSFVVANAVLALKLVAWWLTDSVALFSDAMESIVNVVAAGAAMVALRVAAKPPDARHPFGHAKAEYFSAVLEGALIVVAAVAVVLEAVPRLGEVRELEGLGLGLAISFAATGANSALALHLARRGRELSSPALAADARHLWADVVTSLGVWAGMAAAWATGLWILDPLLALFVVVNVARTGWHVMVESVGGLMDEAADPEDVTRIHNIVRAHLGEHAIEAHDIKTRRSASETFVEFHLVVPGEMTVRDSHALCDRLEAAIGGDIEGARVLIHVEPEREALGHGRVTGPAHGVENP